MKKYYNTTLSTLLFFLLSFNLYGQIGGGPAQSLLCLNADADLVIEDVIWDADSSDLISFYEEHDPSFQGDISIIDLNGIPIPESFHMVELGHYMSSFSTFGFSTFRFDISVAPTAKPVIFVYVEGNGSHWSPRIDKNGYIVGMSIKDSEIGTGVASTASAMGRLGDSNNVFDMCIDIITTNRIVNSTCDLADADYRSCRTLEPLNKEAQDVASYSINFYPNPTKNDLFVEANDIDIQKIELLTLQGQVQNQVSIRYGIDKIQIDMNSLLPGIYLLKLETITETIVEKIIVQ